MSINLIAAENLRETLPGILESLVEGHMAHRLTDDFLVLTPDEIGARDVEETLLKNPRLGGVLTGTSVKSLKAWIASTAQALEPKTLAAPSWVMEALFASLALPASAETPWKERVSTLSLFQLISAFRDERKSLEALHTFVAELDPSLADEARRLSQNYAGRIDASPVCKDFAWQTQRVLRGLQKGEVESIKRIKTLYWLGFPHSTPLLRELSEHIGVFSPSVQQILHIQLPQGMDPQDWAVSHFEGKEIQHFKGGSRAPAPSFYEFPGPFDEAGFMLTRILKLCEEGVSPESIAVFLPSDPFWESYFSSELSKLKLNLFEKRRRPLSSFPEVLETVSLSPESPEEALARVEETLKRGRRHWSLNAEKAGNFSQALKLRALAQWGEVLHQVLFYRSEAKELQDFLPPLARIASATLLQEPRSQETGVALRSHRLPGLRLFSHAFLVGLHDGSLPLNPERFFGRALPDSNRDLANERARFQQLLGASGLTLNLSYSVHAPQTQEISPTPFLFEFGFEKPQKISHVPVFSSPHFREDLEERLQVELRRERDLSYRYPHGGFIQDPELLSALRGRMEKHLFSPAQLQSFSDCPFKFFSAVLLKLKGSEEKEPDGSAAERGIWAHRFLESFFSQNRANILEARRQAPLREKIIAQIEPSLKELSQDFLKEKPWIHAALSQDFMERTIGMTRLLLEKTWDLMDCERPFLPTHFETPFGKNGIPPLTFSEKSGLQMNIGGRIDRLDVTEDGKEFLVFDYKTGEAKGLSQRTRDLKNLQLPLYLLAAERILEGAQGAGALVLGLKEMTFSEGLLKKSEKKRLKFSGRSALYEEEAWADYWPKLKERLFQILGQIRAGDFRTAPDPCNAFCEFGTICRYHEREKPNR